MGIVDKLNLNPIILERARALDGSTWVCRAEKAILIGKQRDELLDKLIENVKIYYDTFGETDGDNCMFIQEQIELIVDITGGDWEEIKSIEEGGLINDVL